MPRTIYRARDGERLKGTTTIISRFKDSGGLLYWANQQGLDGKTLQEARQPAATAGTMAHKLVEHHVNGWDMPPLDGDADMQEAAGRAFGNFLTWAEQSRLAFLHTEHALVSEKYRFGGRFDAVAKQPDGQHVMVDFKTGSLYADHLLQVAAYRLLWNENYPGMPLADGAHLLSFKRETADFGHHYFGGLADEERTFLAMVELYPMVKAIEKRVK